MTTFLVISGIVVLVCAYLAFDWWLAGRKSSRMLVSARDQQAGNSNVDNAVIQRQSTSAANQTWTP